MCAERTCTNTASVSFYPSQDLFLTLSLSPGSSLFCPFPTLLFSLLHFLSHRGSGGPPPQSITVKSQSTAAHSGHCADKLVKGREEKRAEKGKRWRRWRLHLEGDLAGGGGCAGFTAQSKSGHALRQGGSGMDGWAITIGEAPVRPGPSPESCACIQMWACHWYSPPVLRLLLRSASFFLIRGLFIDTPVNVSPNFVIVLSPLPMRFICRSVWSSASTSLWAPPSSPSCYIWLPAQPHAWVLLLRWRSTCEG